MPLTKIRLENFKCFANSGDIPLAPLTVIFGRNNSGKSSILQSLLLLRQTLDSPEYGVRLNLRGPLYPAGTFADIVHQHRSKQHILMQFDVSPQNKMPPAVLEIEFGSDEPQPPRLTRLAVRAHSCQPLEVRRGRGAGGPYELLIGSDRIGGEKQANFRFPVDQFLPLIGPETPRVGRPNERRMKTRSAARSVLAEFQMVLREMRAVGAFRRQPQRRYEYQGHMPEVIDSVGENVVNSLIEDTTRRRSRGELLRTVNLWLKAVGRVRLMAPRRISKSAKLFEIRVRDTDSGRWANFADVGFGIGQAFPVFVEGLRTPEGGTFLIQEPEIHLHPDAQLAMGDFLVSLVRGGRRVIAETHSEHLLLRIRREVLKSTTNGRSRRAIKPKDISIIHVDKLPDGTSHARRLEMDELAQIKDWPKGFMEDATQERMTLLEETAKRTESMK